MQSATESNQQSPSALQLVELALQMLKQNVDKHMEEGIRLERLYLGWRQTWQSQYDQLFTRIETLESRLSPWLAERQTAPQLSLISHQEDAA